MKQLKRSECAILPLVLRGKWYDMIASGEKKAEYRDITSFWQKRIYNFLHKKGYITADVVAFSKGYKKADMFYIVDIVYRTNDLNHPEWGEPETPHYVIKLGERVEVIDRKEKTMETINDIVAEMRDLWEKKGRVK
mgnify:CR=1 FL=1